MLLERGADVTCRDDRGVSALDYVIKKGLNIESATMLAKIGAEKGIMLSGMTRDQTEADFSNQGLQPADTILIGSDLKLMAVLTTLRLDDTKIGAVGAKAIAEALKVNAVLKHCNLLKNNLDIESATMLAKIGTEKGIMFSGMTRDQTEADFSNQGLQPADAILIGSDLKLMAGVTTLDLSVNRIGDEGAKAIAEALKVNAVLKNLSVAYNSNIVGVAAQQLAAAALGSLSLEVLSGVPIKELREDKLTELNLSSMGLGPTEGIVLAELIKFSAVVTTLVLGSFLFGNNIGDEGAKAIAEALKVNVVVTKLWLNNNKIGDDGAKAIAEALKVNAVLTKLYLQYNSNMGDAGERALRDAVKGRCGFVLEL
jgi:Ran GTPase-activating protein (RanGAP) involved in mRNA processing and transport